MGAIVGVYEGMKEGGVSKSHGRVCKVNHMRVLGAIVFYSPSAAGACRELGSPKGSAKRWRVERMRVAWTSGKHKTSPSVLLRGAAVWR